MKTAIASSLLVVGLLVAGVASADIVHDETMFSVSLVSQGSNDYYFVQLDTRVFGAIKDTDTVKLEWKAGGKVLATAPCEVSHNQDHDTIVKLECETPHDTKLKAVGAVEATLSFVDGKDDKATVIRAFKLDVKKWPLRDGGNFYQVSGDDALGLAIASGTDAALNRDIVTIAFWSTADAQDNDDGKLRCTVDGKEIDQIKTGFGHKTAIEVSAIPKSGPTFEVRWAHVILAPFDTHSGKRPESRKDDKVSRYLGDNPGHWKCDFKIDTKLFRQFEFDVDDQGHFKNDEMNTGPGAIPLPPDMAVVQMTVPKDVERRVRPAALKASMGFGLPWPDNAKAKAAQAAFPPQVGADK